MVVTLRKLLVTSSVPSEQHCLAPDVVHVWESLVCRVAGPLLQQPMAEVTGELHAKAVGQWLIAKAAVPLLRDSADSGYIIISGSAGAV